MKTFYQLLEGVYDPNIFKAFFMAGGPGSGKSYAVQLGIGQSQKEVKLTAQGLRVVNSDDVFEKYLKDAKLDFKMQAAMGQGKERDALRDKAKAVTKKMRDNYVDGRLGLVIDGTGRDYDKIANQKAILQQLGYDCYMIFVNTSLDVALERNKKRERSVPEYITRKSHAIVQSNIGKFQNSFGMGNMVIIDNSKDDRELTTQIMDRCSKAVRKLLNNKIKSYTAKRWMATERRLRRRK